MLVSRAMQVIITSRNPVKIAATRAAFEQVFPGTEFSFDSVDVPSGVSEQPASDDESRRGATNRVRNAQAAYPHAGFWVGLEGGLEWVDGEPLASAWMVVADADGRLGQARTPTLPLPPEVKALLLQGLELGEANDRVFATQHSKQAGGAFGLLTGGRVTRQSVYTQTLELALLPLCHPLWHARWTGESGSGQTPPL
jgi:inosine/xanthosine triphosphatase